MTRATVYLNPKVYKAMKIKAAVVSKSFSEIVNDALVLSLREDAEDFAAFDERRKEPARPFEDVVKELRRDGLL